MEPVTLEVYLDPENQQGIRPTRACAERLLWFVLERIPQLERFSQINRAHGDIPPVSQKAFASILDCAKRTNPERIAAMREQYMDAWRWERRKYGNVAADLRKPKEMRAAA